MADKSIRNAARPIASAVMADAFAAGCSPLRIPVEPSMEEITEQCRLMGELMKPAPVEERGGGEGENVAA